MHFLYNFAIHFYWFLIFIASLFGVEKAKKWILGRKNKFKNWLLIPSDKTIYWFHCASLGEFDQGSPLMHKVKSKDPKAFILVTFFSPSGMENFSKRDHCVDASYYLPIDTPKKAKEFMDFFKPNFAFFIKYEFWVNHILSAKKNGVKVFCVSGIFRDNQVFFKWYGTFLRKILFEFDFLFLQNSKSESLLHQIGIKNTLVCGDTRYDTVKDKFLKMQDKEEQNGFSNKIISSFLKSKKAIIIGSSWPKEESLIIPYIKNNPDQKFILAPHDISEKHLKNIMMQLKENVVTFTDYKSMPNANCLLLDTIGHLSSAYFYGKMAFIGGGFSGKLHNILEPAVFGLPTFYGPLFHKFPEAKEFVKSGIGFVVRDYRSMLTTIQKIDTDIDALTLKTKSHMDLKLGATEMIYQHFISRGS